MLVLATEATKTEYSGELGSQNDSKMEPKIYPKVIQKGSLLKNLKNIFGQLFTTLEPCRPPPTRLLFRLLLLSFSLLCSSPPKKLKQKNINAPLRDSGSKITPKVPLGAPQKEAKIHKKSSQNRL